MASLLLKKEENPDYYKMHSFIVSKKKKLKTCEQVCLLQNDEVHIEVNIVLVMYFRTLMYYAECCLHQFFLMLLLLISVNS